MQQTLIYALTVPNDRAALLVNATDWLEVTVLKETSGIVVVGTKADLSPVGSGKGMSIPADVPIKFLMTPDSFLYTVSDTTTQKLSVIIQPLELFSQMLKALGAMSKGPASASAPNAGVEQYYRQMLGGR